MLVQTWFKCVQDIKMEYGILDENIWNFNKTGFQIGVIVIARVITRTNRAGQPRTI